MHGINKELDSLIVSLEHKAQLMVLLVYYTQLEDLGS